MSHLRRIGILGGMGPQATILLQQRLIQAVKADDDADHIPLLVDMNPQVPSRLSWILEGEGEDPGKALAEMAKRLQAAGAEALAMPCNTAHHFAADICRAVDVPLLDMVELVCRASAEIAGDGGRIGVLASPATEQISLFRKAMRPYGVAPVYPENQDAMLTSIRRIKASGTTEADIQTLRVAARNCQEKGAKCLLIGCSEFSLVARQISTDFPILDSLDLLVDEIVAFSGANKTRSRGNISPVQDDKRSG